MGYLTVVISLGILILVHEIGHLLVALRLGIPVERFSLGFGPKVISRTWNGIEYRLSVIPFGGYVLPKVKDLEEFRSIPVWKRTLFSLGGPAANFLLAYLILIGIGIHSMGIRPGMLLDPMVQLISLTIGTVSTYGILLSDPGAASGVVGIVSQGGSFVGSSLMKLGLFSAILSVNLGLFNLLPIPALDGGKVLFAVMERISVRTRKLQIPVTVVSIILLLLLMVSTTVMDVVRLFSEIPSASLC